MNKEEIFYIRVTTDCCNKELELRFNHDEMVCDDEIMVRCPHCYELTKVH